MKVKVGDYFIVEERDVQKVCKITHIRKGRFESTRRWLWVDYDIIFPNIQRDCNTRLDKFTPRLISEEEAFVRMI